MESVHPLHSLYKEYCQLVEQLAAAEVWEPEVVLAMLRSRDRIQQLIEQSADASDRPDLPAKLWLNLAQTDASLGRQSDKLRQMEDLATWRKSFNPPDHHWWWHPPEPEEPQTSRAWLWGGLTVAVLTINLALAQDIATRFLAGAPGVWSSVGAIAPVILALFASGGALTQVGQQLLESLVSNQGVAKKTLPQIKFLLTVALLAGLFSLHYLGLPRFASYYNYQGEKLYEKGNWANAESHFQRALNLQPDFPQAQFNLGVLYEEYQEYDQAQNEYLKATQGDYLLAYNNLARLYLQNGDYDRATPLLRLALIDPELPQEDPEIEYVLRKNLGHVRLEQERLPEAETELLEAVRIGEQLAMPRPDAYCLLAQVLEKQGPIPAVSNATSEAPTIHTAEEAWTHCLQYANRPEYDPWESMAKQALTDLESSNDVEPLSNP